MTDSILAILLPAVIASYLRRGSGRSSIAAKVSEPG
jgi:hypothetical protein